jgi:RNA polymerase sigma factor (sigma-70 family)
MSFPTTAWSMIDDVKAEQPAERLAAMNRFIVGYWRPIYRFIRAKGHRHDAAEDLTQEFLLKFLDRDWLAKADASRGRFRNYLLAILKRFLADEGSGRAPRQKVFDQGLVPVSALVRDEERSFDPPHMELPEDVFMRHWAQALVEEVRSELDAWCRQRGRPDWCAIFTAHHFPAAGCEALTQQALAERFRSSRDQIRYALEQTNQEFARLFRAAVAGQVASDAEIDAEIRDIERLVAG